VSNVRIQGNASGTGTITLQAPNTNTDRTINLPDLSGNLGLTSAGTSITVQDEGSDLSTAAETLNFVGSGVTASGTGTTKTITISGGGGGGGITMADHWRLTAGRNFVAANTTEFITANWERSDSTGYGQLGTGMTESSGVFSFPSTGIYFIHAEALVVDTAGTWNRVDFELHVTTNNSTYSVVSLKRGGNGNNSKAIPYSLSSIIDVTDTSNVKFKFGAYQLQYHTADILGDTNETRTGFTVIRLGDT